MFRRSPIALALIACGATAHADPASDWVSKQVFKKLSITGYRTLAFHAQNVSGDRDTYNSLTNFGQGSRRYTDNGQMSIRGDNVLGFLNFQFTLVDSQFNDPQQKRMSVNYDKGPWRIDLGDIQGNLLNTNQYATFRKSIFGMQTGYHQGRFAIQAIRSESKGSSRTVSIPGTNSTGPYYLQSSQIVNGSEEVRVDGQSMKLGTDYTINYELGSITFISRVVAPTSEIVVSYEAYSVGGPSGLIQGVSSYYDFGRFGRLGAITMAQTGSGSKGLGSRTERFFGFGPGNPAYFLQFTPLLTSPVIVKVDGLIQTLAVVGPNNQLVGDYYFSTANPAIFFFTRPIPTTSEVTVEYTPKPVSAVDGDRKVWGVDYTLPINGKNGFINYSQANGRLISDIAPTSGTARGIKGEYSFKNFKVGKTNGVLKFLGSVSDVPQGYTNVETNGFSRNERATNMGLVWTGGAMQYAFNHTNSSIISRTVDSTGVTTFNHARNTVTTESATFRPDDGLTWSLQHSNTASSYLGTETKLDDTSATASKRMGKLNFRVGLEHQDGMGPISNGLTQQQGSLSLNTLSFQSDYLLRDGWTVSGKTSLSQIAALGKPTHGQDLTFSSSFHPSGGRLGLDASYVISNSGQTAALGSFQNGYGLGYDGNGFSNGSTSPYLQATDTDYRTLSLYGTYRLNNRTSFDMRAYQSSQKGSFDSNSETTSISSGFNFDLGNNNSVTLSLDQSTTRFLAAALQSKTTAWAAGFNGSPKGPWSYRLGFSGIVSGASQFGQDNWSIDTYVRYKLAARQALRFEGQFGRTLGYLPQNESALGMFYEYQIFRNIALVGSYKIRDVKNLTNITTGAYKSHGFDLELSFNFGG